MLFQLCLRKVYSSVKDQLPIMKLFSVYYLMSSNIIILENINQFKNATTTIEIKKVVINNDSIITKYNPKDIYLIYHEHFDNNQMNNKNIRKFFFNASYNNENEYLNDFLSIIKEDISN